MRYFAVKRLYPAFAAVAAFAGSVSGAIAQTSPSSFTTGHRYDLIGREVGTIHPSANGTASPFLATRNSYDADGRLVKVEAGSLSAWQPDAIAPASWSGYAIYKTVVTSYDSMDRKLTEMGIGKDGVAYQLTQYSYDLDGRLQCTAVRMNPALYPAYSSGTLTGGSLPASACTQGTAGTQGPDQITQNVYDAAGQLVQVQRAAGTPIAEAYATYAYSPNGKQTDVIDANGNHTQYVYDGFDRQTQWIFPSSAKAAAYNGSTPTSALATAGAVNAADYEAYAYDANGNRTSLKKRDGTVLTYNYDALNRVTSKVVPQRAGLPATDARSVFTTYDLQGHVLAAQFDSVGGEGITNSFDALGRQLTSMLTMDGISRTLAYQYDNDGNRTRVTHPDGQYVTYNYDGLDRPTSITTSAGTTPASFTYNPDGTRSGFNSNGSAVATAYGYDAIDRLTSLANNPAGNPAYNNAYGFSYSPANQLTQLAKSNNAFVFAGVYNVNRPYSVNGLNQYTAAGTASFAYDANANLTGDGTNTFLYDIENRMVGAGGQKNAALRYDPLGRLYEVAGPSGTTRFLYDGDALTAEYDSSGNLLRRYVHGADMKSDDPIAWYEGSGFGAANERFLRPDWQGSISLVTNTNGSTVFAANTYDEYGIPGSNNTGRFQYTGQIWIPELGMYYYKARMYSPTLGRFLQMDPIGYKDNVNLYAYVADDPMDKVDYTGEQTVPGSQNLTMDDFRNARRVVREHPLLTAAVVIGGPIAGAVAGPVIAGGGTVGAVAAGGEVAVGGEAIGATATSVIAENAGSHTVYQEVAGGATRYVGLTGRTLAARAGEHLRETGRVIQPVVTGLSRAAARATEQALIEEHGLVREGGTLVNKINSIARSNPAYQTAKNLGQSILRELGY